MDILKATQSDSEDIIKLVNDVSEIDVIPHFNAKGKEQYRRSVLPDLTTTFDDDRFASFKALESGKLLGYGAIRDNHYVTHIFVAKDAQGLGVGRALLNALLETTDNEIINLRSSVNAVDFYQTYGFQASGEESEFKGIRFVPMALNRERQLRTQTAS